MAKAVVRLYQDMKIQKRKEAINMKKILILLSVMAIALTFGSAYAGGKDMRAGEYNGITAFESVPVALHDVGPGLVLGNGITAFDIRPAASYAEGSAAGGLSAKEPSMELRNGITIFDTSAVVEPN
jgi:hypothetical protein